MASLVYLRMINYMHYYYYYFIKPSLLTTCMYFFSKEAIVMVQFIHVILILTLVAILIQKAFIHSGGAAIYLLTRYNFIMIIIYVNLALQGNHFTYQSLFSFSFVYSILLHVLSLLFVVHNIACYIRTRPCQATELRKLTLFALASLKQ